MTALYLRSSAILRSAAVGAALEVPGHKVVERAKELAPKLTGEMADSIEGHLVEDGGRLVFRVTVHDWKGHWAEFGTINEPAEPYLGPAAHDIVGNLH